MLNWYANPDLIALNFLSIRWYGIFFASAFIVGSVIMKRIYAYERRPIRELDSLLLLMIIGAVVGARLGHCLFYDPLFYLANPIEIFKTWKGGLASHGGGIGLFMSLLWFSKKTKDLKYLWLLDRIAIPTALGGAFIRIGNFFNSEIIGLPTERAWGVVF